jgi:hypothetical protein
LFIVADVTDDTANTDVTAHPRWGDRIRQAALAYLAEEREAEPPSYGELILRDLHSIFHDFRSEPRLKTTALLDRLSAIEESPWYAYEHGKPVSAMGLARLLKPYGIRPTTIRFSPQDEAKGYYKSDFEDAWSRYLGINVPPRKVVTPVNVVTPVTADGTVSALAFSKDNAEKQPRCLW